ncbi:MAG: hypothetical protein VR74_14005 [Hyphomonas sp. BRH_c22]|nr:MAG: hypothetical protein VR74_14005 [Hyphomonas sp. BRH_c22]
MIITRLHNWKRLDIRLMQSQTFPLMIVFSSVLHVRPQEAQHMQFRHVTEFGDILLLYGFTAH